MLARGANFQGGEVGAGTPLGGAPHLLLMLAMFLYPSWFFMVIDDCIDITLANKSQREEDSANAEEDDEIDTPMEEDITYRAKSADEVLHGKSGDRAEVSPVGSGEEEHAITTEDKSDAPIIAEAPLEGGHCLLYAL